MCENLEELYLLEFYVDTVKYRDIHDGRHTNISLPKNQLNIEPDDLGETIVKFKYFGSNHVEIREEDFCHSTKPIHEKSRNVSLKSGKSCLFSLKNLQNLPTGSFDVVASVFRKILNPEAFQNRHNDDDDDNWEDVSDDVKIGDEDIADKEKVEPKTEFFIGKTDVSLYETFKYLNNDFPSKESLVRENSSMYHGFQDCIDRSYKDGTAVVECHNYLRDDDNLVMGEIVYLVRASCFGRTILTQFQLSDEEAKSYISATAKRTDRNFCGRDGKGDRDLGGDNNQKKGVINEGGTRGEVGEVKRSVEEGKKGGSKEMEQSKPTKLPKTNKKPLDCPFGFDESGEMDLKAICERVCKCVMSTVQNNQQGLPCEKNVKPSTRETDYDKVSPGSVGMVGNQMILRMPDKPDKLSVESKFTSSVYYTQNGEDVGENIGQVVNIRPEYPHMTAKDDPDSKQDVLVLKLGRKRIAAGKKPRIEIEMRTPKFKDDKPVTESKETQYLASDIPKTPKKGDKKGKKGKGSRPGSAKSGKSGKGGKKKK
ncbi:hypothetical protein LSTR_LSTR013655 [Laodelphax striatellus]|uniref:Uncharacterized protein n=1 Tax=Laodelphax striatellus TaxID=195883 RepID=A0A482WYH8_LAOST|nr:hypothetical protein LSTR_LSTR013655 [Laodelphax striatellus]